MVTWCIPDTSSLLTQTRRGLQIYKILQSGENRTSKEKLNLPFSPLGYLFLAIVQSMKRPCQPQRQSMHQWLLCGLGLLVFSKFEFPRSNPKQIATEPLRELSSDLSRDLQGCLLHGAQQWLNAGQVLSLPQDSCFPMRTPISHIFLQDCEGENQKHTIILPELL